MRSDLYQYTLILLGVVATLLFGAFFYRELFPEYLIYQKDYIALEEFRSSYTREAPPEFQQGIKQIVFEREDKGPAVIDRCVSCHVALQIPAFSPTKIEKDINGRIVLDENGKPKQVPNEDYIWDRLEAKIKEAEKEDPREAARLKSLKTAKVGDHVYDVTKVLRMHPLMARETRPFEYHPIEEYGCTSCHNGNGKGLTTEKAHGPIFDGEYETEFIGYEPKFVESDSKNDPLFAKAYNHKPGHKLLFQTTPLFVGSLIQAKCVQCHQTTDAALLGSSERTDFIMEKRVEQSGAIKRAFSNEKELLISLLKLDQSIQNKGMQPTIAEWSSKSEDYTLPQDELDRYQAQSLFLKENQSNPSLLNQKIQSMLQSLIGSGSDVHKLLENTRKKESDLRKETDKFLVEHQGTGSLFIKKQKLDSEERMAAYLDNAEIQLHDALASRKNFHSDIDDLLSGYRFGQRMYISQACYACHKITGFSRGGIGPELTREGLHYPWYIKKKMVWPQFDLKTSTMPNMKMDAEELEGLMTFLLAQQGQPKFISENQYKIATQEWEAGKKMPWEEAIPPTKIRDVNYGMTVFATEGCAACHRLKGFESNVGFLIEKEDAGKLEFTARHEESEWFKKLIPEDISGSELVHAIEANQKEIDKRIVDGVRKGALLEEIENAYPETIESFSTPFKYALRAKNDYYEELIAAETDSKKKENLSSELKRWKDRVRRVLMVYVQEYGLGRLIGPRPNWSGIYRSDEWLMEHFRKPAGSVPNSIMPAFPFDETKFYALTYMLNAMGQRNRNEEREIWQNRGFNPEIAFAIHCAQCHGVNRNGNGPVAEWIYPIPKNLRNADFLRNLTKERIAASIHHGVKGTPMPPWGETPQGKPFPNTIPVLKPAEIELLAEWLITAVPGASVIKGSEDVPKWQYTPEDVLKELEQTGETLKSSSLLPSDADRYYASLEPSVQLQKEDIKEIFDVKPPPVPGGPDKFGYYVKKKYYTEANLSAGKEFFELNCAVCHGAEGDGKGVRAEVMIDAKPRMLSNLNWIDTRDDLRLLRSIKYGVSGTAMTPWGDLTTSLQRLQLVMFIRSLSEESMKRERLANHLYQSFNESAFAVENARTKNYANLSLLQDELKAALREQQDLQRNKDQEEKSLSNYRRVLDLQNKIKGLQEKDANLVELKNEVQKESDLYRSMGQNLILMSMSEETLEKFCRLIELQGGRFVLKDENLIFQEDEQQKNESKKLQQDLLDEIRKKIAELEAKSKQVEGRIASSEKNQELNRINASSVSYQNLQKKLIAGFEETGRSLKRQKELYDIWKKGA